MHDDDLDEVITEFLAESHEDLDRLDQGLVVLEQHPDQEVIARIFRTIHTIKGTSGFLGFGTLESIAHVGESLLSKLRDGELSVTTEITTELLAMVDAVREILGSVAATRHEGAATYDVLIERLGRLDRGERLGPAGGDAGPPSQAPVVDAATTAAATTGAPSADRSPTDPSPADTSPAARDRAATFPTEVGMLGATLLAQGKITEADLAVALELQVQGDPRKLGELLVATKAVTAADVAAVLNSQHDERSGTTETIRVDVRLLDELMNLVGELVLARNQILQFTGHQGDPLFTATSQRLNLITTELQAGVMKTRMQAIEHVWNKFPRVVRDLCVSVGKQGHLEMSGKQTEVDKTLLEAIKDPLTHLIRNAVDHGLETPAARLAAGKPAEGTVRLSAYHEGGQVIIEIADDGAGIDPDVIRRKAVQKGLLTGDEAAARSDREIIAAIFLPGFSTAEQVSNLSGRGVGMDVVRTNIQAIGGTVDVTTAVGQGTTFKVKIPLTLAIIPALLVTVGGARYAIPQVSLLELVRLDGATTARGIERVQGAPVLRLRDRLLPLVFLDEVFRTSPVGRDVTNIVVVRSDERTFGLVVDEITDTAEIVVKPLGRFVEQAVAFAGATIMGDGHVALILDLVGVASLAGVTAARGDGDQPPPAPIERARTSNRQSILVVGLAARRFALPLALVARLEEIPVADVHLAGTQQVARHRDRILPLVSVAERLRLPCTSGERTSLRVLVCGDDERAVGLVVDDIYDIVDEEVELTTRTASHGIVGTTVLRGEVTDVLDAAVLLGDAAARPLSLAA